MTEDILTMLSFNTIESPEDERDFKASDLLSGEEPKGVSIKCNGYESMRITDQEKTSMCTAFSAEQMIRNFNYVEYGKLEDFSQAFIYADRENTDYQGEGDYLRNTLKQLLKNGTCHLSEFNFKGTYPECRERYLKLSNQVKENAKKNKIKSYYRINVRDGGKELLSVIEKYRLPVLISFYVYGSFVKAYTNGGIVPNFDKSEKYYGGHAVACMGTKLIDGKPHLIIPNSYGTKYGDKGVFYIPYDSNVIFEAWLAFDYKKFRLDIPMDKNSADNKNGVAYLNGIPTIMLGKAYIKDNRTMVPLRSISEIFGMEVTWKEKTKSIIVSEYDNRIWMNLNSKNITHEYSTTVVTMDTMPELMDGRTYIPIRFISEMLKLNVSWDAQKQIASISNY